MPLYQTHAHSHTTILLSRWCDCDAGISRRTELFIGGYIETYTSNGFVKHRAGVPLVKNRFVGWYPRHVNPKSTVVSPVQNKASCLATRLPPPGRLMCAGDKEPEVHVFKTKRCVIELVLLFPVQIKLVHNTQQICQLEEVEVKNHYNFVDMVFLNCAVLHLLL